VGLLLPGRPARRCPRGRRAGGRARRGLSTLADAAGLRPPSAVEPFYLPVGDEIAIFEACHARALPVMLKGPTGCGKTRFVEHMSWRLGRTLVTVACHEDLTASDLVGKYTLRGDETIWQDGPLTTAVKAGGIAYLDEIVEARKDTTVVIHPLTDDRRVLPLEKKGEIVQAPENFLLVISYNPGYQSVLKDLKHSTKQRFVAIDFDYPPPDAEETILKNESGVDDDTASKLVKIAEKVRNLRTHGLEEGVSTRLLVYAGQLIGRGIEPVAACESTICKPITDDLEMQRSIVEIIHTQF
jgi:nitric oxide reductase NorQ protein